jgi:hypothetical protein
VVYRLPSQQSQKLLNRQASVGQNAAKRAHSDLFVIRDNDACIWIIACEEPCGCPFVGER